MLNDQPNKLNGQLSEINVQPNEDSGHLIEVIDNSLYQMNNWPIYFLSFFKSRSCSFYNQIFPAPYFQGINLSYYLYYLLDYSIYLELHLLFKLIIFLC